MPNSASVTAHLGAPAHPSLEVIHRLPVNKINQIARFGLDELFLSTFTKTQHSHLLGRRIIGNFTPPVDARAVKHTIYSEKVGGMRCPPRNRSEPVMRLGSPSLSSAGPPKGHDPRPWQGGSSDSDHRAHAGTRWPNRCQAFQPRHSRRQASRSASYGVQVWRHYKPGSPRCRGSAARPPKADHPPGQMAVSTLP
jgi:hypothetical protein